MDLNELARRAGFHVNETDVFSPHRKEKISSEISNLLTIIEKEVLHEVENDRPAQSHDDAIRRLFSRLKS